MKSYTLEHKSTGLYEMPEPYKKGSLALSNSKYRIKELPPDDHSESGYIILSPKLKDGETLVVTYAPLKDTSPPLQKKEKINDILIDPKDTIILKILKEHSSSIEMLKREMSKKVRITDVEALLASVIKDIEILKEIVGTENGRK